MGKEKQQERGERQLEISCRERGRGAAARVRRDCTVTQRRAAERQPRRAQVVLPPRPRSLPAGGDRVYAGTRTRTRLYTHSALFHIALRHARASPEVGSFRGEGRTCSLLTVAPDSVAQCFHQS